MSDLFPITLQDQIAEIEREVVLRERVYPRWIASGKLPQHKADRQLAVMTAVLQTLYELKGDTKP